MNQAASSLADRLSEEWKQKTFEGRKEQEEASHTEQKLDC